MRVTAYRSTSIILGSSFLQKDRELGQDFRTTCVSLWRGLSHKLSKSQALMNKVVRHLE